MCKLHKNDTHHCKGLAGKKARPLSLAAKPKQKTSLKKLSSGLRFSIPTLYPLLPLSLPTVFLKLFLLCALFPALMKLKCFKPLTAKA